MEGGRHSLLDTHELHESLPELACKKLVPVTDNLDWKAKVAHPFPMEQCGTVSSLESLDSGDNGHSASKTTCDSHHIVEVV